MGEERAVGAGNLRGNVLSSVHKVAATMLYLESRLAGVMISGGSSSPVSLH